MTPVDDACAALAEALPLAQALTAIPDTDGGTIRGRPGSRPPWNTEAANALFDATEGALRLEAALRYEVTGVQRPRRPTSAMGAVLDAIPVLAGAADQYAQRETVTVLMRGVRNIHQLHAVDLDERPQQVKWACRYCGFEMVRLFPRSGRVTCLRVGECFDTDGRHPMGVVEQSALDDVARIYWADGLVT